MKSLKYILFLILIISIGLSIYIAVQPNSFEVIRTRNIKAPSAVIYDNVIDFKNWKDWSSWVKENPDIKITLPDLTQGVDGSYSWEEDGETGTMKTLETTPNKTILQEMQITEYPKSDVSWDFKSLDNGSTDVTWTISGKDLPFGFKAFTLFSGGMEKQIGPHYERSLEMLDSIVTADMKKYSITVEGVTQHSGGFYLYNTASCRIDELDSKMKEMLPQVFAYATKNNISMAGAPFVFYHKWDVENNAVIFSACVPTTSQVISNQSGILTGQLLPFKAVKTILKGDYSNLKEAWDTTMKYIPEQGYEFTEAGPMLETYLTDPNNTPNPANWTTEIYIAIK